MNAHNSIPPEDPVARAERAARRLAMLDELAETGMEISRRIRAEVRALDQVETVEDLKVAPTSADLSLAFSRVSRAVRQTLAMEARLEADAVKTAPPVDYFEVQRERFARAADGVRRWIEDDAAARAARRRDRAGAALADEDLDDADDLDDLDEMDEMALASDAEVVARVCRDLGVEREVSVFRNPEADGLSGPPRVRGGGPGEDRGGGEDARLSPTRPAWGCELVRPASAFAPTSAEAWADGRGAEQGLRAARQAEPDADPP